MSYVTKTHVRQALLKMKKFHYDLHALHDHYGLSMLENTGRRNILMSSVQEEFFAEALSSSYNNVTNNGRTGEPDIFVGELDKELECKITTPTPKGGINLQTDYRTLQKKGSLDFLYVIADREFEKFVDKQKLKLKIIAIESHTHMKKYKMKDWGVGLQNFFFNRPRSPLGVQWIV